MENIKSKKVLWLFVDKKKKKEGVEVVLALIQIVLRSITQKKRKERKARTNNSSFGRYMRPVWLVTRGD